ncbi:DsrE family protein [Sphingomonas jeddahensis]|uniref:DsrE/DsrF-like family protein n=1 Tax=Sphingomonas jeddahensis TaxID=1915074 RepID=A0A1V2EY63_9SPHN|nr:DsrE family protein [Sphingomonas jeddahensis]ONF97129.1 DsrE/DsrF-like family protein [Sphingomonas jeddahensis]
MPRILLLAASLIVCISEASATAADDRHPVVQNFGAITKVPDAKERPDPSLRYRVLFDISKGAPATGGVNPGLEKVARFLNLLGGDGVRPRPGDVVVVIHGPATSLVLSDAAYAQRNKGGHNPNLPLIAALRSAGVSMRVCSQALLGNRIASAELADGIEVDVSAMTTLATLQLRGWALIPD